MCVCVHVIHKSKKVLNRIACYLVGFVIIRVPFDYILGSVGSKVKVMKRSTFSFYYQFISNWHATNANIFINKAQSCDMQRYALYRVPVLVLYFIYTRIGILKRERACSLANRLLQANPPVPLKREREETPSAARRSASLRERVSVFLCMETTKKGHMRL
ncbi:hypothetical protein EYF80_032871 [Liparis tanakae]|uniref:Uncharacterized protein n=1 Tax=Liparis tanakae TaxID=230148 RepID=A0A4Z2GU63_9TELE|nr:hypothetical protein EYF80_032871 [Liparis tanakae]